MNVNLELYRIFYNVAKNKNITKTANEMMITQPSISKAIKNLEEQLGCQLFIRSKHGVSLTEEGNIFYNDIKNAMEIIENAENNLKNLINLEGGTLSIGASHTITEKYLMKYINIFNNLYPKVKLKIVTGPTQGLIKDARNGLIDLIVLNLPYLIPSDFNIEKTISIQDGFYASNNYKELKDKTISLKELNNYPLILLSKGSNTRYFLDNFTSSKEVTLVPKIELTSYSLEFEFTKIGLGIGYLTKEFSKDEIINNNLFEIKTEPSIPKREIGIIYCNNKKISNICSKFIELLKKAS